MSQLTSRDYKGTGGGRRAGTPGGLKEFLFGAAAGALLATVGTVLLMHHAHRPGTTACAASATSAHTTEAADSAPGPAPRNSARIAARATVAAATRSARTSAAPERSNPSQLARASGRGAPSHAPGKAAPAPPQYDFYQMLPNLKVTVPRPTAPGMLSVGANGHTRFAGYVLQVGSYRDEAQARRVIAELDSLGIIAHIDSVPDGRATLHRVRIGPLTEAAELNRIRGVLKAVGLPAMVIPRGAR